MSVDIVIAKVLELLGYRQGEIEETLAALAPKAEINPMYHRLAVMQGRGFEDGDVVRECVEMVRRIEIVTGPGTPPWAFLQTMLIVETHENAVLLMCVGVNEFLRL